MLRLASGMVLFLVLWVFLNDFLIPLCFLHSYSKSDTVKTIR